MLCIITIKLFAILQDIILKILFDKQILHAIVQKIYEEQGSLSGQIKETLCPLQDLST